MKFVARARERKKPLAGLVTIVFSYCGSVITLAVAHAAIGFTVWICRIIIDGRVLQICTAETVGRTRVYIEVMFSFSAMAMCLSPSLVKLSATSDYFLYWGAIVVVSSLLLWSAHSGRGARSVTARP